MTIHHNTRYVWRGYLYEFSTVLSKIRPTAKTIGPSKGNAGGNSPFVIDKVQKVKHKRKPALQRGVGRVRSILCRSTGKKHPFRGLGWGPGRHSSITITVKQPRVFRRLARNGRYADKAAIVTRLHHRQLPVLGKRFRRRCHTLRTCRIVILHQPMYYYVAAIVTLCFCFYVFIAIRPCAAGVSIANDILMKEHRLQTRKKEA